MRVERIEPAREFAIGDTTIRHCADVTLEPDEQVTFTTPSGTEYDVARKSWGYYATPSLNRRLPAHGLRALLARNPDGRLCVLLVERGHEAEFETYRAAEGLEVVHWLDDDDAVARAVARLAG